MGEAPDNHDLARRLAVLEERMNTKAAETESALDRLRADMAARDTDAAKRETDAAKRETRMLLAIAGMIGLAVAVLGFLIRSGG